MTNKAKGHSHFSWQSGYGAFSVSQSAKESVIAYIASQEMHHRKMTFPRVSYLSQEAWNFVR
jgi:hypothetical protein